MDNQEPREIIQRYLQDAIAAEKSFETQLRGFAKEGDDDLVKSMFAQHADETRDQYEALESRLKALGGDTSTMKSVMAHMFNMAPKAATVGHEKEERTTQNLMMAFAVENSEIGMYECLAATASAAGDRETESLARRIQNQERETAEKIWRELPRVAVTAFERISSGSFQNR